MKRNYVLPVAAVLFAVGCGRGGKPGAEPAHKLTPPEEAVRPAFFAAALRALGGAHYHGVARLAVGPAAVAAPAVTTTTDLSVDRTGNYRLSEQNDRDGGREVVLHGRELAVALRYGKMIRRIAEEPEPTRILEEAVGAPWAAFELVAPRAKVTTAGTELYGGAKATVYQLALAAEGEEPSIKSTSRAKRTGGDEAPTGLRAWRATAAIEALSGKMTVDDATGALMRADIETRFSAKGETGPIKGVVEVHAALSEMAATPPVARPEGTEELAMRQRIVPEQKEMLRGLPEMPRPVEPKRRPPAVRRAPAAAAGAAR